jgi:hypothetical protein
LKRVIFLLNRYKTTNINNGNKTEQREGINPTYRPPTPQQPHKERRADEKGDPE